jgi:hypothetical protein
VRGCTALLDALGDAIRHIVQIHRYARPEDVPARTTFVIMTDGMENASRRYNSAEVKRMIEHEKEKYGWEFLFLAANIDAVETAGRMGIRADRAVNYNADGNFMAHEFMELWPESYIVPYKAATFLGKKFAFFLNDGYRIWESDQPTTKTPEENI